MIVDDDGVAVVVTGFAAKGATGFAHTAEIDVEQWGLFVKITCEWRACFGGTIVSGHASKLEILGLESRST